MLCWSRRRCAGIIATKGNGFDMSASAENRIGWLKLSAGDFTQMLQGRLYYQELVGADDLEILDVKIIGQDVLPIVMIGIATSRLAAVAAGELVAPTIPWNPIREPRPILDDLGHPEREEDLRALREKYAFDPDFPPYKCNSDTLHKKHLYRNYPGRNLGEKMDAFYKGLRLSQ